MTDEERTTLARLQGTLDRLTAFLEKGEAKSSVEITQNAKGEARVTVKVYGDPARDALQEAMALYDEATSKYAALG